MGTPYRTKCSKKSIIFIKAMGHCIHLNMVLYMETHMKSNLGPHIPFFSSRSEPGQQNNRSKYTKNKNTYKRLNKFINIPKGRINILKDKINILKGRINSIFPSKDPTKIS